MVTLVSNVDVHVADRVSRRKVFSLRSSFGDIEDNNQLFLTLARGESKEIEFSRFIFAHFRDEVTLELIDDVNSTTITYTNCVGAFVFSNAGKIRISVDPLSTISLDRVINLVYS